MGIRFIFLMIFGMVLLFNAFLDGLNMTVSNKKSVTFTWIKNGIIRFIVFFIAFAVLFIFEGTIGNILLIQLAISLSVLLIMVEVIFSTRRQSLYKKIQSQTLKFLSKQLLVYLGMAVLITYLFRTSTWMTYVILFFILSGISILAYFIIFKWLIFYFFKQVPLEMPFDSTIYDIEPTLKDAIYVIQSKKIYLPMNALLMGIFKTKKVLLTPALLGGLSSQQIQAIIAHEVGHYHHKHLWTRFVMIILVFMSYLAMVYIVFDTPFISLLALESSFILFITVLCIFMYLIENAVEVIFYQIAHKQEYQADAYAAKKGFSEPLARALEIIDYQGAFEVHPLYQRLKLSHPNTGIRIARLRKDHS